MATPSYAEACRDTTDYSTEISTVQEAHDIAYVFLDQANCFEEAGRKGEALEMYYKGLLHLNEGLDIRTDFPHCTGRQWNRVRDLQTELRRMRQTAHDRIYALSDEHNMPQFVPQYSSTETASPDTAASTGLYPHLDSELPPTYHEAVSAATRHTQQVTPQPAPGAPASTTEHVQMSARLLLRISAGVQVFHINNSNEVQIESDPTELCIYTLNAPYQPVTPQTLSWIQVAEFTYPLVPNRSPVLKTGYGAYMFPDVAMQGNSLSNVALVLSADVSDEDRNRFDQILKDYAAFQEQNRIEVQAEDVTFGQRLSEGIVAASEGISRGLVKGAQATSVALNYGAEKIKERMTPEQRAYAVDPRVQTGLKVARATTHVTCKATGFMVGVVGDMALALGRRIAKSVAQPEVVNGVQTNGALNDAILIAGGSIAGFGTVFMGLENAAKVLAQSITTNTVTLVHHKYGGTAGEAVGDALYSVGNLALTANNVSNLGVRGIAKKTAKEAGKAVLQEYASSQNQGTAPIVEEPDDNDDDDGSPNRAGPSKKKK